MDQPQISFSMYINTLTQITVERIQTMPQTIQTSSTHWLRGSDPTRERHSWVRLVVGIPRHVRLIFAKRSQLSSKCHIARVRVIYWRVLKCQFWRPIGLRWLGYWSIISDDLHPHRDSNQQWWHLDRQTTCQNMPCEIIEYETKIEQLRM